MKLAKRLLLALLAPLLFLGGAEWALRLAGYGHPTSFFVPAEINGRPVWTDNPFFGYRFFAPRLARTPPGAVIAREKAPGTIRVFVLGESAAMGDPLAEFGPARQLASLLEARYPGKRFEVVNAAMTAINSHVIAEIAREAARLRPDAFVLYIGNNEIVGPYGPGTVFGPFSGSGRVTRARVWATRLRGSQLLRSARGPWAEAEGGTGAWEGLEMFAKRRVPADDPQLASVRGQFRANIEKILEISRAAGAEAILCTVAVNLRDCPPLAGADARGLYARARELDAAGNLAEANAAYERARDRDELRVRADGALNGILREIGSAGRPGVRFVDAERRFREFGGGRVPGDNYFLDHVHFNFAGTYALAADLAAAVAEIPALRAEPAAREWPALDECRDRLLYTVWSELDLTDLSLQRIRRPPFKDQPGQPARVRALIRHREELLDSMQAVDLDEVRPRFLEAMRAHPDDWHYPAGWSAILYNADRNLYAEAERHLRAALALAPHLYEQRAALAMVLGFMGRAREGIEAILGGDRDGGLFPAQYLAQTGRLLAENGKPGEAVEFLREAARRDPEYVRAEQDLATCFVRLGRLPEAEAALRAVLKKRPGHAEAAEDLASLLAAGDRWNEAEALFRQVRARHPDRPETRMKYALGLLHRGEAGPALRELEDLRKEAPDFAPGRYNLGLVYAQRQQWADAAREFETTVELQPDAADAQAQLARVRRMQEADFARRAGPEPKPFSGGSASE